VHVERPDAPHALTVRPARDGGAAGRRRTRSEHDDAAHTDRSPHEIEQTEHARSLQQSPLPRRGLPIFCQASQARLMSTMNISLPEALRPSSTRRSASGLWHQQRVRPRADSARTRIDCGCASLAALKGRVCSRPAANAAYFGALAQARPAQHTEVKAKRVVPRVRAQQDVEEAIAHYLAEDAAPAARRLHRRAREGVCAPRTPPRRRLTALRARARHPRTALLATEALPTPGLLRGAQRPHRRLARAARSARRACVATRVTMP